MRLQGTVFYTSIMMIVMALSLSACGKKEGAASKAASQVVAKVNGQEILVHQVNFQLSNLGPMDEAQSKAAARQVLTRLVSQQLLKQKAVESKLDKDPRVLLAMEAAKDQILAQAFMEQEMGKVNKPSATEIDKFYTDHPELFQERRVFNLQELAVETGKDKFAEIEKTISSKKTMKEIAEWLKDNNYKFAVNANARAAEQLSTPVLQKLQPLKDGDTVTIENGNALNIVHISASQSMPITRDKAVPIIQQFLLNQSRSAVAKNEMESLTKSAKVEYMGEFSNMQKIGSDTTPVAEVGKETPKEDKVVVQASDAKQSHIDKGLAGL